MSKRGLLAVVGLALAGLLVLGAVIVWRQMQGNPIPTGAPSGELAFMSNRSGKWELYLIDADGQTRSLTAPGDDVHDYFPSWSFSGDMLNFLTSRAGEMGPGQVRPDGSELRTLGIAEAVMSVFLAGRLDWDPNWSPDGQRLGWASLRDLNLEIYVANRDGSDQRRLTSHPGRDWFLSWSPDGGRITFSTDRHGVEDIYIIDPDGENMQRLTDSPGNDLRPVWSDDGQTILFVSERDNSLTSGQLDLFVMNPDGSDQRRFGADERFSGGAVHSPDGQQIAYIANSEGRWNIYVMDADGGNRRRITDSAHDDLFPVWRPAAPDAD